MTSMALDLFPASEIASAGGPIKVKLFCLQVSTNSGFSARNPYPG